MEVNQEPDFAGWATKNDLECSDGLTIKRDAFKHNDGIKVPLVYQHQHNTQRMFLDTRFWRTVPRVFTPADTSTTRLRRSR